MLGNLNADKSIEIYKNSPDGNQLSIRTISGQLIQNITIQYIYKNNHGFIMISNNNSWEISDDDKTPHTLYISPDTGSDFPDIESAIIWANANVSHRTKIIFAPGDHYINDTVTITNSNIISIEGA